jgi:hypothetical protein
MYAKAKSECMLESYMVNTLQNDREMLYECMGECMPRRKVNVCYSIESPMVNDQQNDRKML